MLNSPQNSKVKLISLNIEGDKHLDRVIPFLKTEEADVICLQEVFGVHVDQIAQAVGMKAVFAPSKIFAGPNRPGFQPLGEWGIAWMTKLQHTQVQVEYYAGQGPVPENNDDPNHANRPIIWAEVIKNDLQYRIATTHFTWSPAGKIIPEQERDFRVLADLMASFDSLVLCGDFNAPRGEKLFSLFEEVLVDHLPKDIITTLDPELHRVADLKLVVDTIFSTPDYQITGVKTVSGVSDHQAVVGNVSRRPISQPE
jgi:endonuclease/exonuclease/phosphatase family metal-dependent hydrolase